MDSSFIRSDYKPGELTQLCNGAISEAQESLDAIARIAPGERNVENTLLAFEKVNAELSDAVTPLTFMGYVSIHPEISREGHEVEEKISQFMISVFTRKDLYLALKKQKDLSPNQARLLKETLQAFEDNGLKLPDDQLQKVKELKQLLSTREVQFSANLNQDQTTVEFSAEELQGVPQEFLKSLKKAPDQRYILTTKEPHYIRLMENAIQSETRRKMLEAYENRAALTNTKLLEEAIELRSKIATMLGYSNWADYRIHTRMAKSAKQVQKFLNELKSKLIVRSQADLAKLSDLKKESDPKSGDLKSWDIRYYSYQLKKQKYDMDDEMIREYFPAGAVISGLFETYSKLFGVKYLEDRNAKVWAEGVKFYEVREQETNELLAYFYTDFFPRTGKFGHAAAFSLRHGREVRENRYQQPISAIVANFSPAEEGKPSLLKFEEVKTVFHEFGHIMHQTLTRAPYASLSGTSVDQDFVEAPSQVLENWPFAPEILSMISGHYKDRSKKLPADCVQKIIEARDFNQGYHYVRQLFLATLDLSYHTSKEAVDTTSTYKKLYKDIIGIHPPENSHFQASFGHLMGGYDAGYYGYLWSEVYAADLFSRFEKEGILNSKVGLEYRKTVLETGKMLDGFDILRKFLNREPNAEAFFRKLHIN